MSKAIRKFAILACLMSLTSCTVIYRGLKYGNAAVDDYTVFEQDTVDRGFRTFTFAELPESERVLDTMKVGFYHARLDSVYRISIPESMEMIGKPAAALIIRNDTIVFEHYHGGWDKKYSIMYLLRNQDHNFNALWRSPQGRIYQKFGRSGH